MYCGNCGNKIEGNVSVCPNCQKAVEQFAPQAVALDVKNPGKLQAYEQYNQTDKLPAPIGIALGVVSSLFVLFLGLVIYVYAFGGAAFGGRFDLQCDEVPVQTDKQSIILSGTIKSGADATLTLNGEIIETVSSKQKEWSESVVLEPGENAFVLTLSDDNGHSKSRVLHVESQANIVYPAGTVLNLTAAGVYIRPTPNKSDKFVVLLWDTATDLVCLGEEATDAEGYLWFKVNTPHNGSGWVRNDLVKVK